MKHKKIYTVISLLVLCCVFLTGCGKKQTDPASEQVLKITITPEPSPTPAPDQVNSDAVVKNGNITMVNSYLEEE